MVAFDYSEPTVMQVILRKFSKRLESRRDRQALGVSRVNTWMQSLVRLMLNVAGFALLTIAAFTVYTAAGFVMAGISCFALAWLAVPSSPNASTGDGR